MAAILSTAFAAPVTDWATTFPLASVTGVQKGHVCAVQNELAQVLQVGPGLTLKVLRGIEGTATAAHATSTPVAIYRADEVRTGEPGTASAAGTLRQVTATLTDAQIKALPGTGEGLTVIVPAPGVNKLIVLIALSTQSVFATAYSGVTADAQLGFVIGPLSGYVLATATKRSNVTTFLGVGTAITVWPLEANIKEVGTTDQFFIEPVSRLVTDWYIVDAPLNFYAYNGTGNFTGGHASNTLTVSVLYGVLDVTTGVWV